MKNEMVSIDRETLGELLAAQKFLIKEEHHLIEELLKEIQSENLKYALHRTLRRGIAIYNSAANSLGMKAYLAITAYENRNDRGDGM